MKMERRQGMQEETFAFLAGGGEMGELVRSIDWSSSPLGPIEDWPQSLRTTVSTCLNSRFPILIFWGPSLVKIYNDGYRPMLGEKHPRAMGAPAREVWPEIWHIIGPMINQVVESGEATWSENQLLLLQRHGFAEECYFTFSYSPIFDEHGKVAGVYDAAAETTREVIGERRLRALHTIGQQTAQAKSAEEACLLTAEALADDRSDVPFALLYLLEPAAERAQRAASVGLPPEHPLAPSCVDLAAEAGAPWPMAEVAHGGRPHLVTEREADLGSIHLPDDAPPAHSAFVLPIARPADARPAGILVAGISARLPFDDKYREFLQLVAGQVATAVWNTRNARDRAELLEREQAAREAAERASRAKDDFLAMLGHELRNPLAPILTALQLMRLRGSGELEKEREMIERQARQLVGLIDDLLDVSRITRGKIDLKKERIELAEVVANAIEVVGPLLERGKHNLNVEVPRQGLLVNGDRARLIQVVTNLLNNAAKYTESGGNIDIDAERSNGEVVLEVRDSGIGIDPNLLPKVFDMFTQARQSIDRLGGGLGLGLAIVRSLVVAHGGRISAHSAGKGHGSAFVVRLPASEEAEETPEWQPPSGLAPPARQWRILVVDDNEDAADSLAAYASALGHITCVARDGPAALRAARQFAPDVALIDIGLPIMDGYELARRLQEETDLPRPRLFAVTGYGQPSDVQRSRAAGFDAHLVKPLDTERLRELLEGGATDAG